MKLGALFSSGKDSNYAMYLMQQKDNEIACLILMKSENKASYMFHTPAIDIAKLQAEAMEIPIVEFHTKGEKEIELDDLEKALKDVKKKYDIDGITTGALFSDYQRKRIENICEKIGLKVFSPLWHKDQLEYMNELIDNRFKFIMTGIAAEGLNKTWLGRLIEKKDIEKLAQIHAKLGINVAGEGGEFETLVIDSPMFKKKIEIKDFEIKEDNENTAIVEIKEAVLMEKHTK